MFFFHFWEQRLNNRDILSGCFQKEISQKPKLFHKYHKKVTPRWCRAIIQSHLSRMSRLCHECDLMVGSRCVNADWPKDPASKAEKPFDDDALGSAGRVGIFWAPPLMSSAAIYIRKLVQKQTRVSFSTICPQFWPLNWVSKLPTWLILQPCIRNSRRGR